jgi:hypothetical protein
VRPVEEKKTMVLGTVKDLLTPEYRDRFPKSERPPIYMVSNKTLVFYIGKSKDTVERLRGHLGLKGTPHMTDLGRLVRDNLPQSLDWGVTFIRPEECRVVIEDITNQDPYYYRRFPHPYYVRRYYNVRRRYLRWPRFRIKDDITIGERVLIEILEPCLNLTIREPGDASGRRLPERYRTGSAEEWTPARVKKVAEEKGVPVASLARLLRGLGDRHPEALYLASLSPEHRRTMRQALDTLAGLLTGGKCDAESLNWGALSYSHTAAIVREGVANQYSPATASMLYALRGVLKEARR